MRNTVDIHLNKAYCLILVRIENKKSIICEK